MKKPNLKLLKLLPGIRRNISLKNYTTFKIGGRAKYFFVAKNKRDLILAVKTAKILNLPFFILGGGSNLVISDKGFNGLVIKIQDTKYKIQNTEITAEAGMPLTILVNKTSEHNLTGLEWAAGIPGTVGGAVFGNAGAFGKSMADNVKEVEVFNSQTSKIKKFQNKNCKFGYRNSFFKRKKNLIILSITLQFKRGEKKEIQQKVKKFLEQRRATQPLNFPSAGSVFKNPKNFSAGLLIEKCGLKGKKIRGAKISEKHANFIINLGDARAKDVEKLISLAKKKVKNKFNIILEEEIRFINF